MDLATLGDEHEILICKPYLNFKKEKHWARSVKMTLNLAPAVPREPLIATSSLGKSTSGLSYLISAISYFYFWQNRFLVVNGVDYTEMQFM